jgi:DNA polymerase
MSKHDEMKKIRDELLALTTSPLYVYRTENHYFPVVGEGSHDAHIMFIGEAPGETEAKTARPFCGRSGKMLDELLASIGLDRQSVYITNLVKDRPQDNRDPEPSEIALYAPFLDRQIDIIQPRVIGLLGRHSMKYIFERFGLASILQPISKLHGQVFIAEAEYGPITIIAFYHPAAALYNGSMKPVLVEDFKALEKYK